MEFIILNSNIDHLTEYEAESQLIWYRSKLDNLEIDNNVKAVIVCCHHSPYTNSKIIDPNDYVREFFVTSFLKSKKCAAFLSGHSHAFEHFVIQEKHFFVIGGGGGLQQPLLIQNEARWRDEYNNFLVKRLFHFLYCEINFENITFNMKQLNSTMEEIEAVYKIIIPI